MIGDFLQIYTYQYLLEEALSTVPNMFDKREGSVIYDAIAPACYILAEYYMQLYYAYQNTFASTASGDYLDRRTEEQGIYRQQATYAVKRGEFYNAAGSLMNVPLGSRFSTISDANAVNYYVEDQYTVEGVPVVGVYRMRCETAGTVGNEYTGRLIAISNVPGLAEAILTDLLVPAQDTETDDQLRDRFFNLTGFKSFSGNVAQYTEITLDQDGVGAVQVYPVWNGGGTVKLSIVDPQYNPVSEDFMNTIGEIIDPENYSGQGIGLAPIDHHVTISTATEVTLNISANISFEDGLSISALQAPIETAVGTYIDEIRASWGVHNDLNQYILGAYIARITAAILSVSGVTNVADVKINDSDQDRVFTETSALQEIPVLGTVTLGEI